MFLREVINSLMRSNPWSRVLSSQGGGGPTAARAARTCMHVSAARVKDGSVLLRRADVDK